MTGRTRGFPFRLRADHGSGDTGIMVLETLVVAVR